MNMKLTQLPIVLRHGLVVLFLLLASSWGTSYAQTTLTGAASDTSESVAVPSSPEEVRELVSRLSDQEVRSLLLERLDAVAEAATDGSDNETTSAGVVTFLKFWAAGVSGSVRKAFEKLPVLVSVQGQSFQTFASGRGVSGIVHVVGVFLGALFLGFIAERIARYFTRDRVANIKGLTGSESLRESFRLLS